MGLSVSTTSCRQGAICGGSQQQRPRGVSIHILDDDSLLHTFYLYRPFLLGEDEDDNARLMGGNRTWNRGRWWYRLAHVCQRWRNIILGSTSYLGVSLVCSYGTPVADMLAHSPPLPLVLDYNENGRITTDDEVGILLALKQRERVLRVRLNVSMPVQSQRKLIAAIDEEYPILEHLIIGPPDEDLNKILTFSETFQAPRLRHFRPRGFALPIGLRLLTSAVGLVTLYLVMLHPSTYFHPNTLLQWISHMPQLETLTIYFHFPIPGRGAGMQLMHAPTIAPVTLPNLRHFRFRGVSSYLETLVHRITTPRLKKLQVEFFSQLTFFVPRLLQLMNTEDGLRFHSAHLYFVDTKVGVAAYPHGDIGDIDMYAFDIAVFCWHLDWQVSSVVQISNSINQVFSAVENLSLVHHIHGRSSEEHNEVDRTEWRRLLRPFTNVKALSVDDALVKDLSRCLQLEDGELPLEVLPELETLTYSGSGDTGDGFTSFIDARRNAGRPITLVRQ